MSVDYTWPTVNPCVNIKDGQCGHLQSSQLCLLLYFICLEYLWSEQRNGTERIPIFHISLASYLVATGHIRVSEAEHNLGRGLLLLQS